MVPTVSVVRLELQLEGPRAELRSVISALADKPIEVPPVRIRIRKVRGE